jgi:hypothetical protein
VWSTQQKGLRDRFQLFDHGSIATFHPTLGFLREPFEKPDHVGRLDLRPLQCLTESFGFRLAGMAKHTDIRLFTLKKGSSALRQLPAFVQNITDGDAAACQSSSHDRNGTFTQYHRIFSFDFISQPIYLYRAI